MTNKRAYALGKLAGFIALTKRAMPQSPMGAKSPNAAANIGYGAGPNAGSAGGIAPANSLSAVTGTGAGVAGGAGGAGSAGSANWMRTMMAQKNKAKIQPSGTSGQVMTTPQPPTMRRQAAPTAGLLQPGRA